MSEVSFTKVKLPYGWLGNMAPYGIRYHGLDWRTSEALFQAYRFAEGDSIRETIRAQKSPMGAKMVAKSARDQMVIKPMSQADLDLMATVLLLKIEAHPYLRRPLRATGGATLIEDSSSRSNISGLFWGAAHQADDTWKGENHLGKLWMKLRDSCRVIASTRSTGWTAQRSTRPTRTSTTQGQPTRCGPSLMRRSRNEGVTKFGPANGQASPSVENAAGSVRTVSTMTARTCPGMVASARARPTLRGRWKT